MGLNLLESFPSEALRMLSKLECLYVTSFTLTYMAVASQMSDVALM